MLTMPVEYSSLFNSGWGSHFSEAQFSNLLNGNNHCEIVVIIMSICVLHVPSLITPAFSLGNIISNILG